MLLNIRRGIEWDENREEGGGVGFKVDRRLFDEPEARVHA